MALFEEFQDLASINAAIYDIRVKLERVEEKVFPPTQDGPPVDVTAEELDVRLRRVESRLDDATSSSRSTTATKGGK